MVDKEFEAEKELLRYFTELPRAKATQILSVVGMYFIYFQIALNNDIRTSNTSLYSPIRAPWGELWPSLLEWKLIPVSPISAAFGVLTVILIWQILGLVWYVGLEQQLFNAERPPIELATNERPLVRVHASITSAARGTLQYGPFQDLAGFRAYTAFWIPLLSYAGRKLGFKRYQDAKRPQHWKKSFLRMVGVLFVYWGIVFPYSIGLIRLILSI